MADAARASDLGPILIDRYLQDAVEVDVDVLADGETVAIAGVMEHVEEAASIRATAPAPCRPTRCRRSSARDRAPEPRPWPGRCRCAA